MVSVKQSTAGLKGKVDVRAHGGRSIMSGLPCNSFGLSRAGRTAASLS